MYLLSIIANYFGHSIYLKFSGGVYTLHLNKHLHSIQRRMPSATISRQLAWPGPNKNNLRVEHY